MGVMAERPWGFWTESKLDMLSAYMRAFTTASKRAGKTVYLDLFAGQETNVNKHTGLPIDGSLRRALSTEPIFSVLRGFELRADRASSLQKAYRASAPGRDVLVYPGDVHLSLPPALSELSNCRWAPTFAFVDPDGCEARWELFEALAAHKGPGRTKVELFLLLVSPQIVRVVNNKLDARNLQRAERQVTDLFGSDEWRPILADRQACILDAERTRDELTNLMRWRLERALGYKYTHTLRLTNLQGTPLYDMIFATDHPIGDKIMSDVYRLAATRFPNMRREIRARRQDQGDTAMGSEGFWTREALLHDSPLSAGETYHRLAPSPPYGSED
jgi:three-Cys-motif partner protein